jgi:hypothetical protein
MSKACVALNPIVSWSDDPRCVTMRIEKPGDIAPAIKDAVRVTETGAPFLLEVMVKEGYDFSRYPLAGL